ncbi:MAG TPA: glycosyltransferase, partial [Candidatus Acidoferrum sp.]|nr:glycosyltransferase [Candidatus Acidoferrum sp.]
MTKARKGQKQHKLRASGQKPPVNDIAGALALAGQYSGSGKEERILEALAPIGSMYPFSDKRQRVNYNRLLAFGHAHLNQFIEAESAIRRGLADMADCLDLYYVLCYVKLSLREYADAIAAGETYLNLRTRQQADPSLQQSFASSVGHLSQLCNFVGVAYRDSGETKRATFYFEKAIVADPGNHLPYLNLANLQLSFRKYDTALEVIRRGLSSCRQVHELRILEESARNRATVSACMIVRNEEELLGRCLESIRDWVDEIVVVDTGSTDRTEEIAKSYGARVFHQPWEGDFSKHRNYSLERAICDWTLVIDADEQFCR